METEFLKILDEYWIDLIRVIPKLVLAVIILLLAIFLGRKISGLTRRRLEKRLDDLLLANFLGRITNWIITLIGIMVSMEILGLANFAGGIIAGAGVSAIIIGFAFKDIGENFLSGLILAFNRPFNIGDVIETEKISGTILSLDLRTTTIRTFQGYIVSIPNSMIINNPLINYNKDGKRRFDFIVGIDYSSDVDVARSLILDSITQIKEILEQPTPFVIISELTSSSINLRIFFWINALTADRSLLEIESEVIEKTLKSFKENGVNIPFDSIQVQFNKGIPEVPVNIISNENKKETIDK